MMSIEPRERRRLSDLVANRIFEYIRQHNLQPGDRLPTEFDFAKQLGVSRVTVREVTKSLTFLGFLTAAPRIGTVLRTINLQRVTQLLELHPSLQNATSQQLIDARLAVEVGMLSRLSKRMQQDAEIYSILSELTSQFQAAEEVSERFELDREFHCQLIRLSGISALLPFHELMLVFFDQIYARIRDSKVMAELVAQHPIEVRDHQRIIDSLRDDELDHAEAALTKHIQSQVLLLDQLDGFAASA
jgi:GntR family transcriptional regulator, transcriptional repressor for pyruvate dehydrogenase complex